MIDANGACLKNKIHDGTLGVFLYSDEEYQWPTIRYPEVRPIEHGLFGKVFNRHKKQHEFPIAGDMEFWPFISATSFQRANENPVLLSSGE